MRGLVIAVMVLGLAYVLGARRRFDLLSVAFLAACVYFSPALVGFAAYPTALILVPVALSDAAYLVMLIVLSSNLLFLALGDALRAGPVESSERIVSANDWPWQAWIATSLGVVGLAWTAYDLGGSLFGLDKTSVMEQLGRGQILWASGATLGCVSAYVARAYVALAISVALLVLNLFVGFRVELVIAILAIAYLALGRHGAIRLASRWRMLLVVGSFGFSMIAIKQFLAAIKLADVDMLLSLAGDADAWRLMFANAEPFITQGILNEVIASDFRIDPAQLADAFYLLVPFAGELGAEVRSFNAAFQPTLFSSVTDYGLANNFWAQMWSAGGMPLVSVAAITYHAALVGIDGLRRAIPANWQPTVALIGIYLAFYIHRNDLVYQLTLERRMLTFGVLTVGTAYLCRRLALSAPAGRAGIRPPGVPDRVG